VQRGHRWDEVAVVAATVDATFGRNTDQERCAGWLFCLGARALAAGHPVIVAKLVRRRPCRGRAAAIGIASVIVRLWASRRPRNTPGNTSTLLIWLG
jgi:hypothetical protein